MSSALAVVSSDPVDRVLARLDNAKPTGSRKWMARCPAHEDETPSLSVAIGNDGRVLLTCFAGCEKPSIVAAIGLTMSDLFAEPKRQGGTPTLRPSVVATYQYVDEDDQLLFEVQRKTDKTFPQR